MQHFSQAEMTVRELLDVDRLHLCEICDRPAVKGDPLDIFARDVVAHRGCVPAQWLPGYDPRPRRKWRVGYQGPRR